MPNASSRADQEWLLLMQTGQNAYASTQIGEAELAFARAVRAKPERMEGWVNLGVAQLALGNPQKAAAALEQAKRLSPGTEAVHLMLANAYADSGDSARAILSCRDGLAIRATANLWNRLGTLQRIQWLFDDASSSFLNALQCDPEHQYARVNLATLRILQGRHEEARKSLAEILDSNIAADTRAEAERSYRLLADFNRMGVSLTTAFAEARFDDAIAILDSPSSSPLQEDSALIPFLEALCSAAQRPPMLPPVPSRLADDWPVIEAHFSLHKGETVAQYLSDEASRRSTPTAPGAAEVFQYAKAVAVRRSGALHTLFNRHPEAAFRYSHWMILNGVDDRKYCPGHFKLQPNFVRANPLVSRTPPECVPGTIRRFYQRVLPPVSDAETRAAIVYLMIVRTHSYIDGNGRVARYLLNYELERGNQAPILIPDSMRSDWTTALRRVYREQEPGPMVDAIRQAREFTAQFLNELDAVRGNDHLQQHTRTFP